MISRDSTGRSLIDLHLHLEGSLPAGTAARLARRHGLQPPNGRFEGFAGFLRAFGAACDLMRDPVDFEDAAHDVIEAARRRGLVHVEILFSPQVFLRRGIALETIVPALLRGRRRANHRGSMSAVFIADGVRQWGPSWFGRVVRGLAPWAGAGVAGIGLGGDETALPASRFAACYRDARDLGFHRTIHAGETGGPGGVSDALTLPVERIGHGIGAAEDADLMALLARRRIPLEVCPSSNVATGVVRRLEDVPVRRLLDAGVRVTINSDDGAFFHTDAAREIDRATRTHGLDPDERLALAIHAAEGAFLSPRLKRSLRRRVEKGT